VTARGSQLAAFLLVDRRGAAFAVPLATSGALARACFAVVNRAALRFGDSSAFTPRDAGLETPEDAVTEPVEREVA